LDRRDGLDRTLFVMTRLVVALVGVSLVAALPALAALAVTRSSGLAASRPARWVCPARFAPLPSGWVQGNLGLALLVRDSVATTNNWAHTPRSFANLNDIPRDGIYIWAILSSRELIIRRLRLPLSMAEPDEIAEQEGAPRLPEYRFAGRFDSYSVDLRVDFGRHRPTRAMLLRAQTLLLRLRLPRWFGAHPSRC
jgi:hypothetical protein